MRSNKKDRDLIDTIANLWIASGGDAEGFFWLAFDIREAIEEKQKEKKKEEPDHET